MTKRMLIDATHAEETRVVVLDGNRLEDFDVETSTKRQLKGNIYLAKVVRVEPSLQAAFVEYGGNRHGFLAFSEIHPDYYQIPVADRQRLIDAEAEEARLEEEEADAEAEAASTAAPESDESPPEEHGDGEAPMAAPAVAAEAEADPVTAAPQWEVEWEAPPAAAQPALIAEPAITAPADTAEETLEPATELPDAQSEPIAAVAEVYEPGEPSSAETAAQGSAESGIEGEAIPEQPPPETVGGEGDATEETHERRPPSRFLRNYKIQEVIKRRQILLVQVVKEERGTKGAALTTYLSLAGRFCVLMPNSPRGGGISRKITSVADRRRLKEIMAELAIPRGMGLIVRTAGANRPKSEIRRDCEYLLRLWDEIRERTLKSVAPALIYEEASLIKRTIRDVYSRDIDDIQVDGEEGWHAAHEFMRMLMPTHAKKVQLWRDGGQPLFAKYQVEAQLDAMLQPTVQLRSGGYLVINQAEALVAIDVNSGRSTRERNIEETALRTNLEAADEVARQLRLRDLAGLIVIDFIDMEAKKHNAMVERRLKEALKIDRARIQVGHISHFGLMEMSRQRLRPSLAETSFIPCPHCGGTGHVRSTESAAIHVLRGIEDEGAKRRAAEIVVYAATSVALYILNHKRARLQEIELRYGMRVLCLGDDGQMTSQFRIERVRAQTPSETQAAVTQQIPIAPPPGEEEPEAEEEPAEPEEADEAAEDAAVARGESGEAAEDGERPRRRRRRRRHGGRREETAPGQPAGTPAAEAPTAAPVAPEPVGAPVEPNVEGVPEHPGTEDGETREPAESAAGGPRLGRGRRGGRRRRQESEREIPPHAAPGAAQPDLPPVYAGPTPANPFGSHTFDIFDVLEQAEAAVPALSPVPAETPPVEPEPEPPIIMDQPEPEQAQATDAEPAPAVSSEPEPEPALAANDAAPEPLVKPIVIGSDQDAVVEKKRGWWRR